jgi:hypothetical protein
MNKFYRKLFPLAGALLFIVACGGGEGAGVQGTPGASPPAAAQSASPASAAAQQPQQPRAQTFRGLIGEKLRVQMSLRREGDALSGSYSYEGRKGELSLEGSVDGRGDLVLREYAAGGAQTGLFKGKWGTSQTGEAELTGEWLRPDGSRAAPFTLTELPVELAAGAAVVTREIKEEKKRPRYTAAAQYPQIEGAGAGRFEGFNRAAAAVAAGEVNDFRKEMADWEEPAGSELGSYIEVGYSFGVATDDLVSVLFDIGDYYGGAAHPNHRTRVVNYDVRRGRGLELADLFKPSAPYLKALSDYCVKDLKRQFREGGWSEPEQMDAGIEEGAAPDAENYRSWLVTRRGLAITFDPYSVAPYAAGPQSVFIPYSALRDIVDPDGPLAPFVR